MSQSTDFDYLSTLSLQRANERTSDQASKPASKPASACDDLVSHISDFMGTVIIFELWRCTNYENDSRVVPGLVGVEKAQYLVSLRTLNPGVFVRLIRTPFVR